MYLQQAGRKHMWMVPDSCSWYQLHENGISCSKQTALRNLRGNGYAMYDMLLLLLLWSKQCCVLSPLPPPVLQSGLLSALLHPHPPPTPELRLHTAQKGRATCKPSVIL
jgi:hypothetical protein